jgi:hypothetical protein
MEQIKQEDIKNYLTKDGFFNSGSSLKKDYGDYDIVVLDAIIK